MAKSWAEKDATQPLKALAKSYGVEKNPLVLELIGKYESQKARLVKMLTEIGNSDLTCTKEYVKGRKNVYTHPAISEYNKTSTAANQTVQTLMKIVTTMRDDDDTDGEGGGGDELMAFLRGRRT